MKYTKLILDERMIVPEPKIRLEFFLHAIVTGETCELKPKTVDEEYLYAIATSDTSRMGEIYPRTLVEIYYDAILNNSVEDLPTPRTRWEEFLRSAVTKEPCELEPETSLEIYLSQISSNGGFDYIVSTSTNSTIISLPNSTSGIIKSIEIDGNTLVNYCTNGSEELTLNNEINVQGTDVTLTDTVDNGNVDVVCEGNTLVNLISNGKEKHSHSSNSNRVRFLTFLQPLKQGVTYTIKFKLDNINLGGTYTNIYINTDTLYLDGDNTPTLNFGYHTKNGYIVSNIIPRKDIKEFTVKLDLTRINAGQSVETSEFILLEGDYTNKPIPSYFEGMKSVGELEDNKIEIISTNSDNTLSNKKEIQLSDPLRGLPDGVCDKFVKQSGKWYVERNCIELLLDGITNSGCVRTADIQFNSDRTRVKYPLAIDSVKSASKILCDKLVQIEDVSGRPNDADGISVGSTSWKIMLNLPVSLVGDTDGSMNSYLQQNNLRIVAELATPTYEEITDPQVITYLDTTHISTNSTIPCNMQVKNSGYNTIIKPSTQYTVAFDTDKSGEVGINLGGAKVTATNNVATITTPSTLTDDALRLYGKGIKASNVRLLEGDKTNYVPSYFEGMKSCFEDNKVKIISRNKNLFTNYEDFINITGINNICISSSHTEGCTRLDIAFYDNNFNRITDCLVKGGSHFYKMTSGELKGCYRLTSNKTQLNSPICVNDKPTYMKLIDNEAKYGYKKYNNIQIEEGTQATPYVPHKSNSIQLQLNEPLRAVGDVKDRFVFKDDKLMIERNCGEIVLNGSEGDKAVVASGRWFKSSIEGMASVFILYDTSKKIGYNTSICERFTNTYNTNPFSSGKTKSFTYTDHPTLNRMYFNYGDNPNVTTKEFCEWLSENPTKVVYQLEEPTYEEIPTSQRLVCYEDATLFIDTNITPTHVEIEYPIEKQQLFRIKGVSYEL